MHVSVGLIGGGLAITTPDAKSATRHMVGRRNFNYCCFDWHGVGGVSTSNSLAQSVVKLAQCNHGSAMIRSLPDSIILYRSDRVSCQVRPPFRRLPYKIQDLLVRHTTNLSLTAIISATNCTVTSALPTAFALPQPISREPTAPAGSSCRMQFSKTCQ